MDSRRFVKKDEGFVCENCGNRVEPLSYSSRNHCPACLFSKHLDVNPGDRASNCQGIMAPIEVVPHRDRNFVITHRCQTCGFVRKNRSQSDDDKKLLIRYTNPYNLKEDTEGNQNG